MANTNTVSRSLHDVGLASWFGGSLMGAIGLNGAAANATDPTERVRIAALGWKRWAPVNGAAIAAHLVGGVLIVKTNKGRLLGQAGVARLSVVKTAVTIAALTATGAAGYCGMKIDAFEASTPTEGATEPKPETSVAVARAQKMLQPLQWAVPVLTGALLLISARMGEQQRPTEVASGVLKKTSLS